VGKPWQQKLRVYETAQPVVLGFVRQRYAAAIQLLDNAKLSGRSCFTQGLAGTPNQRSG
jgi:hypothetical protein